MGRQVRGKGRREGSEGKGEEGGAGKEVNGKWRFLWIFYFCECFVFVIPFFTMICLNKFHILVLYKYIPQ